jgi:hypothetical protein
VIVIGIVLSSFVVFAIATLELNILAHTINTNPKSLGLITDNAKIMDYLNTSHAPPQIITTDPKQFKLLQSVAVASVGKTSYFGHFIVPSISQNFVIPVKKSSRSLVLIDNTLIVSQINGDDLKVISPQLGYLFVKNYFSDRQIKLPPIVNFLDRPTYLDFRKQDALEKQTKLDFQIQNIQTEASDSAKQIPDLETNLAGSQKFLEQVYKQRESQYQRCLVQKKQNCDTDLSQWDNLILNANNNVISAKAAITNAQNQLTSDLSYIKIFQAQKNLSIVQTDNIPHEFGFFHPDKTINIAIDSQSSTAVADYFETLTHEYLHYSSYSSDKKVLADAFFEEGLTEYFARQAIKRSLDVDTNLGYPMAEKLITQITKRIPETQLEDIYFNKDQAKLEKILDLVYGDGFYKSNRILLTLIQFTSDPSQSLNLGNQLMSKLGGDPIKQSEIYTTYSSYQ